MIIGNDRIACLFEISRIQENLFALHRKASSLLTGAFFALRPIVIYYLLCCLVWFLFLFGCQRSVTLLVHTSGRSEHYSYCGVWSSSHRQCNIIFPNNHRLCILNHVVLGYYTSLLKENELCFVVHHHRPRSSLALACLHALADDLTLTSRFRLNCL